MTQLDHHLDSLLDDSPKPQSAGTQVQSQAAVREIPMQKGGCQKANHSGVAGHH